MIGWNPAAHAAFGYSDSRESRHAITLQRQTYAALVAQIGAEFDKIHLEGFISQRSSQR
jgi:hypothetical protein